MATMATTVKETPIVSKEAQALKLVKVQLENCIHNAKQWNNMTVAELVRGLEHILETTNEGLSGNG